MSNFRTTSFKEGGEPYVTATLKQDIPSWGKKQGQVIDVCCDKFRGEKDKYQCYSYEGWNSKTLVFVSGNREKIESFFDFKEKVVVELVN
jgi:hypothetical protein